VSSAREVAPRLLRTERLELHPFVPEDRLALHLIFIEPSVRRYLLDDTVVPLDWVDEEIESSAARFQSEGAGLWTIRRIDSDEPIGFVGFRPFFDPPQRQLLYGLLPEAWGHGFATESAQAVMDFAFTELGFDKIVAATDRPNRASEAVMRRLGMTLSHVTDDDSGGTVFYSIVRPTA